MQTEATEELRRFYETHRQELFTYALALTRCQSGAEDAVHTAFSHVLERGRMPRDLRPYLFRCVRNAAIDGQRIASREQSNTSLFNGRQSDGVDLQFRLEMEELLVRLPNAEREVIVLKLYSGLTFREIARVQRIPQGTAASLYRRGIDKLRAGQEGGKHGRL